MPVLDIKKDENKKNVLLMQNIPIKSQNWDTNNIYKSN